MDLSREILKKGKKWTGKLSYLLMDEVFKINNKCYANISRHKNRVAPIISKNEYN